MGLFNGGIGPIGAALGAIERITKIRVGGTTGIIQQPLQGGFCILLFSLGSGYLLDNFSDAALPYLDSFTTWGAIVTTWMVARKIIQNWHYWFIIDSVSVYLYINRGLVLTALLFVLYLVLIVIGYRQWRKSLENAHV